jgi:acylphosphatase
VQGVGFRAFVWREAGMLGVEGWVRNRTDGTVEALVMGDSESVEALVERLRSGPRFGRVDRLEMSDVVEEIDAMTGFSIRRDH